MRGVKLGCVLAALCGSVVVLGQTRTWFAAVMPFDATGNLRVAAAVTGGAQVGGPKTLANTPVNFDSNGLPKVVVAAGTMTPDTICLDATNQDVCLSRVGSGIGRLANATGGWSRLILGTNDASTSTGGSISVGSAGVLIKTGDGTLFQPLTAGRISSAQATPPTCATNCGTSPTIVGSDTSGIVTMGATGSPASGWVLTFNGTWAAAPACHVTMALTGMAVGKIPLTVVTTTTTMTVVVNGVAPANNDKYAYECFGVQ